MHPVQPQIQPMPHHPLYYVTTNLITQAHSTWSAFLTTCADIGKPTANDRQHLELVVKYLETLNVSMNQSISQVSLPHNRGAISDRDFDRMAFMRSRMTNLMLEARTLHRKVQRDSEKKHRKNASSAPPPFTSSWFDDGATVTIIMEEKDQELPLCPTSAPPPPPPLPTIMVSDRHLKRSRTVADLSASSGSINGGSFSSSTSRSTSPTSTYTPSTSPSSSPPPSRGRNYYTNIITNTPSPSPPPPEKLRKTKSLRRQFSICNDSSTGKGFAYYWREKELPELPKESLYDVLLKTPPMPTTAPKLSHKKSRFGWDSLW